ncbi:MAG: iron ABC transporter permease [Bacteroidota bacterium]|nr:iron ABC transporter permease [Bacteroidota bacterium]
MKKAWIFFLLIVILFFSILIDLKTGSIDSSVLDIFNSIFDKDSNPQLFLIVKELRFPRIITAILVGTSLPVSGLLLQTLFRNPLAGPYIFGISSGASFGVALMILGLSFLGFSSAGNFSIAVAGIIGASLVLLIILLISLKIRDSLTILIIGVFLGSGISAVVSLMQYFASAPLLKKFIIWSMGSLDAVHSNQLGFFTVVIVSVFIFSVLLSKFFDSLYLGDENAQTMGINVKLLRISIFVITGIMTGIVTAYCGPIGFIGIAIPHLSRIILKSSKHIELIIFSAILGAIVMLLSDALSHSFSQQFIPINTITAIVGIPIIIWVVFKNKTF